MNSIIDSMQKSKNNVPDYNVNFLHNSMCHTKETYKYCDKCIPKNNSVASPCFTISRGIGQVDKPMKSSTKLLPYEGLNLSSFLKICATVLLVCDLFYLHIDLHIVKDTLRSSAHTIENLESQLKFTKLSYDSFKADVNYIMYLNRLFTKDINSKIELLIKLNKLFVDQADTSLNSVIDIVRNQKASDNEITRVINKRKSKKMETKNLKINRRILYNKQYKSDEHQLKSLGEIDGAFEAILNTNNVSSLNSFDFMKNEVDPKTTFIETLSVNTDGGLRTKRQIANGSQPNNRGKNHSSKSRNKGHHRHINCNLFCCSSGKHRS